MRVSTVVWLYVVACVVAVLLLLAFPPKNILLDRTEWACTRTEQVKDQPQCVVYERKGWR